MYNTNPDLKCLLDGRMPEERITTIMNTKETNLVTRIFSCVIVFVIVTLFAITAIASSESSPNGGPAVKDKQTSDKGYIWKNTGAERKTAMSIVHESADILYYEDGSPYIHDILTNNTDKTVTETQYCMLAYDENGLPLKLHWNFLDSSAESSFENVVQSQENIIPGQTQDYRGGWSLCDGEIMEDFPKAGNSGVNQVTYVLFCLEQVVFEDGSVWNNPDYENWFDTYAGKEMETDQLQNYYPYVYQIVLD